MIWPVMYSLGAAAPGQEEPVTAPSVDYGNMESTSSSYTLLFPNAPTQDTVVQVRVQFNQGDASRIESLVINGVDITTDIESSQDFIMVGGQTEYQVEFTVTDNGALSYFIIFEDKAGEPPVFFGGSTMTYVQHDLAEVELPWNIDQSPISFGFQPHYFASVDYNSAPPPPEGEEAWFLQAHIEMTSGNFEDIESIALEGFGGGRIDFTTPDATMEIPVAEGAASVGLYVTLVEGVESVQFDLVFQNKPGAPALMTVSPATVPVHYTKPSEIVITGNGTYNFTGGAYNVWIGGSGLQADVTITARVEMISGGDLDHMMIDYHSWNGLGPTFDIPLTAGQPSMSVQVNGAVQPSQYRIIFENKPGERAVLPTEGSTVTITHS